MQPDFERDIYLEKWKCVVLNQNNTDQGLHKHYLFIFVSIQIQVPYIIYQLS